MNPLDEHLRHVSRRSFLGTTAYGIGATALSTLLPGAQRAVAATSSLGAGDGPARGVHQFPRCEWMFHAASAI